MLLAWCKIWLFAVSGRCCWYDRGWFHLFVVSRDGCALYFVCQFPLMNIQSLFEPKSIAVVVGASRELGSVRWSWKNLVEQNIEGKSTRSIRKTESLLNGAATQILAAIEGERPRLYVAGVDHPSRVARGGCQGAKSAVVIPPDFTRREC